MKKETQSNTDTDAFFRFLETAAESVNKWPVDEQNQMAAYLQNGYPTNKEIERRERESEQKF